MNEPYAKKLARFAKQRQRIMRWHLAGKDGAWIGRELKISRERVRQIIAKEKERQA